MVRASTRKQARAKRQTRKAPAAHAADLPEGTIKHDGKETWIVLPAGSTKRWQKATGYFTHDNGGRPFYVQVRSPAEGGIQVRALTDDNVYGRIVLRLPRYERAWIGENTGQYANRKEQAARGNSVLVHVAGNKYIYIGDRITEFSPPDGIREFHGIMGNSDVVYAFGIGTEHVYLFTGDVYLPRTDVPPNTDPYSVFYADQKLGRPLPRRRTLHSRTV
jgi:hypothetical protein